jgi:hypothetical protein
MLNFNPHSIIQRLMLENQKKLDKIDKALNQSDHNISRKTLQKIWVRYLET